MRKCKDWLKSYMQYTKQAESPDTFHLWCGLSAIAAALRRNVWMNMGFFEIYPNMYIVLIGPPACRKTSAINAATGLFDDMPEIHFGADSITREALIRSIKNAEAQIEYNGTIHTHSSVTVVSKELSVFLGSQNIELLSLLTDLFDCPKKWVYRTKNMGTEDITGVWLNLLGASTPTWLTGSIPMNAIGGGFTSRIVFVVEDGPRHRTAIPILTNEEKSIKEDLIHDIIEMTKMVGEFKLDKDAMQWFVDWYENRVDPLADDIRFAGYSERKHIHLLKTSMLLSASESSDRILQVHHIAKAEELLSIVEPKMIEAFGAAGRSATAQDVDMVIKLLEKHEEISKEQLIATVWRDINYKDISSVINALIEMGLAKIETKKDGKLYIRRRTK